MTDNRISSPTQRSNSQVQKDAEGWILAALADAHPEIPELTPTKIVVGEAGAYVEVDGADSSTPTVVVEAYARQGVLKGAQLKKIGQDILKLALLRSQPWGSETRCIIAFASAQAQDSIRGWLREAASSWGVELMLVELSDGQRAEIVAAQGKQLMVNAIEVAGDLTADTEGA